MGGEADLRTGSYVEVGLVPLVDFLYTLRNERVFCW